MDQWETIDQWIDRHRQMDGRLLDLLRVLIVYQSLGMKYRK